MKHLDHLALRRNSSRVFVLHGAAVLEQRLFEEYKAALADAQRDNTLRTVAFAAWDAWLSAMLPDAEDRSAIPDPKLLGRRGAS
jgi:hypothetical protein